MAEPSTVDARGLKCPMPIVQARKRLDELPLGSEVQVVATDPGSVLDFQGWARSNPRIELLGQEEGLDDRGRRTFTHRLRRNA